MHFNLVRCSVFLACSFILPAVPAFSQDSDPLSNGVPVSIIRKTKPTRRPGYKKPVERAPLLKLEWRFYKVLDDGSQAETALESLKKGDRIRLSVRANQDGYLYVIHQTSTTSPGQIVFPESHVNNGSSAINRSEELVLPSNCPVKTSRRDCALILTAGEELFHLFFTRDPFNDLPNSALDVTGSISPETLEKLKHDTGQNLKEQNGSTPFSKILVNINTKDNEEIIHTLEVNKRP